MQTNPAVPKRAGVAPKTQRALVSLGSAALVVLLSGYTQHAWPSAAYTLCGLVLMGLTWKLSRGSSYYLQVSVVLAVTSMWLALVVNGLISEFHLICVGLFASSIVFLESQVRRRPKEKLLPY